MGKSRDLVKKIRDTKGTFHAKMGSIKVRNGMELTEAEDIKKTQQQYTEELYRKDLNNYDGVITHLEPDILECEVKWALGSVTMDSEVWEKVKILKSTLSGEGNGNPLWCSCLENPRDGGAWWAAVSGVAQSRTRLKGLSSSSNRYLLQSHFFFSQRILFSPFSKWN